MEEGAYICKDVHESPTYKVVLHTYAGDTDATKTFVFSGDDDVTNTKALAKKYKNYKNRFALRGGSDDKGRGKGKGKKTDADVQYVKQTIYHDDTIMALKAKVVHHVLANKVSSGDIYIWGACDAETQGTLVSRFVTNLFNDRLYVSPDEFVLAFANMTGNKPKLTPEEKLKTNMSKQDIAAALLRQHVREIQESLAFKHTNGGVAMFFPADPAAFTQELISEGHFDMASKETVQSHALLLESYSIRNATIHVTTKASVLGLAKDRGWSTEDVERVYFPFSGKLPDVSRDKLDQENAVVDAVVRFRPDGSDLEARCSPNYVHLRINERLEQVAVLDTQDIFMTTAPDEQLPFIKHISPVRTLYKAYKPYLLESTAASAKITQADMAQWTKLDNARFLKNKQSLCVFMFYLGKVMNQHRYAKVFLFDSGMYDVKFNFRINEPQRLRDITAYMESISAKLQHVLKAAGVPAKLVPPIDRKVWVKKSLNVDTKIAKMLVIGSITTKKSTKTLNELAGCFRALYPFFSVISTEKGTVHMLYKRIPNFTQQENIFQHMNRHSILPKQDMIRNIIDVFNLEANEAVETYTRWAKVNKVDSIKVGSRIYYQPRAMHVVSVKLKPTKLGYMFMVSGATDVKQQRRIVHAIKYGITCSGLGQRSAAAVENKSVSVGIQDLLELANEDLDLDLLNIDDVNITDDVLGLDTLLDDDNEEINFEDTFYAVTNEANEEMDTRDMTEDVRTMKENMKCPKALVPPKADKGKAAKERKEKPEKTKAAAKTTTTKKTASAKKLKGGAPKKKAPPPQSSPGSEAEDTDTKNNQTQHEFFLKKLREADAALFDFKAPQPKKTYAKNCQVQRQPVVLTKKELEYNNKCFPGGITSAINYGTNKELAAKNYYACPRVWCPKSRVAMSTEQFNHDFKGKCPFGDIEEQPMTFLPYFPENKGRNIGFLKAAIHPDRFELPCCFKNNKTLSVPNVLEKSSDKKQPAVDDTSNNKYIMGNVFPLQSGRLGLLPPNLGHFFGNESCGGKEGKEGLINKNTNCYLRFGLPLTNQSFLLCMATLLGNPSMTIVEHIPTTIEQNLSMELFLSLNDGLLCRKFIDDTLDINNPTSFERFRSWFKTQQDYVMRFNLKPIANTLAKLEVFDENVVHAQEVVREFLLYSSYSAFIRYLKDPRVPKTHDMLIDLASRELPWFNAHGFNILVFETDAEGAAYLSCPMFRSAKALFRKEKPVIMLIKQAQYYEPIYLVKYTDIPTTGKSKAGSKPVAAAAASKKKKAVDAGADADSTDKSRTLLVQTYKHNYKESERVYKVIKYYMQSCDKDQYDPHAPLVMEYMESHGMRPSIQVLDHDLRVVGFAHHKSGTYIPLDKPFYMQLEHASTFMFADTFLQSFQFNADSAQMRKLLTDMNRFLKTKYFSLDKVYRDDGGKELVMVLASGYAIPLRPYKDIANDETLPLFDELHDAAIFVQKTGRDARTDLIDSIVSVEKLQVAFRNELIKLIGRVPVILDELMFLRHSHNPMPKVLKRKILKEKLDPYLSRLVYKEKKTIPKFFVDTLCTAISKSADCVGQCQWVVAHKQPRKKGVAVKTVRRANAKPSGTCKLGVPKSLELQIYNKALEDLLNPTMQLKPLNINDRGDGLDTTLLFSDQDVATSGIDKIVGYIENPYTFDTSSKVTKVDIEKFKAIHLKSNTNLSIPDTRVEVPTILREHMKGFSVAQFEDDSYDPLWIYEYMRKVYNTLHPKNKVGDAGTIAKLVHGRITEAIKTESGLEEMAANPFVEHMLKKTKQENSVAAVLTALQHKGYAPGDLEIKALSGIVGINIVIYGRQTKRNPDRIRCLGKHSSSSMYMMFNQRLLRKRNINAYEPFVYVGNKYMFQLADFGPLLGKCLENKCRVYKLGSKNITDEAAECPV